MAHVVQTEVAKFQWMPLAAAPYGRNRAIGEPFGLAVHTEDALAIDDIGVGDTGGFILQLPLPVNYAYRLLQASLTIRDEDGNVPQWRKPALRMFWHPQQGINPAETTELTYPMSTSFVTSAELLESAFFNLSGGAAATDGEVSNRNQTNGVLADSIPLMYGYTPGGGIDSEFMMTNGLASQTNYQISYQFRWLVYSIADSLTTSIYWPKPTIHV